jgi:hypothetical protein
MDSPDKNPELVDDNSLGLLIERVGEVEDPAKLNTIELNGADTETVSFTVPEDAKSGDTIHIIAVATDDGPHTLKRYQRVIVTVA